MKAGSRSLLQSTAFFLVVCALGAYGTARGQSSATSSTRSPFVVAPTFPLGAAPTSVAAGDLNGDGKPDLVVTTRGSGAITVLLGTGSGGFAAGVGFPSGQQPDFVHLADVNEDGKLDAVVADAANGTVEVLLGNGDGSFAAPVSYTAITNPVSLTIGDFQGKGKIDVAVAGGTGESLAILLNDGTGHFSHPASYVLGETPESVTAAPLRGTTDDLIAANADGTVSVLLGDGSGNFQPQAALHVATGPLSSVTAGDLNGDGKADLAVTEAADGKLAILTGRGDGSFVSGSSYAVGNQPAAAAVADVNGDGIADLVTANEASNTFSVLIGNGDGTFQPAMDYTAGDMPVALATADFNGDGHADLALANAGDSTLSVPAGQGDGTFVAAPSYSSGLQSRALAVGDVNGDGLQDLVVANFCSSASGCSGNGTATVFAAQSDGTYRAGASYSLGAGPVSVELADVNGDRRLDLIAANRDDKTLTVMLGNGDATFGEAMTYALGSSPRALAVGDVNNDGKTDVLVAEDCGSSSCAQAGAVELWLGKGDGSFTVASSVAAGYSPFSLAVGDVNGDGNADLVVGNSCGDSTCAGAGTAMIDFGNGHGGFTQTSQSSIGSDPSALALGGLSGKGATDLVVAQRAGNQISVFHNDGLGNFKAAGSYAAGSAPSSLAIADFTGDGRQDVAVANFQSSSVTVFAGNGDGTLGASTSYAVGTGPQSLAAVAPTGSGPASLITANGSGGSGLQATSLTALNNKIRPLGVGSSNSTTTLMPAPNPAVVGEPVTLTATVTGGSGTPTGTVTFQSGGTNISDCTNPATLDASGTTVCATSSLALGSNTVTASYGGDGSYKVSSDRATVTVNQGSTTTTVTSSGASVYGQAVTLTATVTVQVPAVGTATGAVTFKDGANALTGCTNPATLTGGVATCTVSSLAVGSHTITAVYAGDTDFSGSSSSAYSQTVSQGSTTTTATSSAATAVFGQSVVLTATVAAVAPAAGTPSGAVTFKDGANPITGCTNPATLNGSGVASCTVSSLAIGSHSITAAYAGDTNFTGSSNGTALAQTINQGSTTTAVTSSAGTAVFGQSVVLTATVAATAPASGTPTGSVTFKDGANPITGCTNPATLNGSGIATCTVSSLAAGSHSITAAYAGDTNFAGSSNGTAFAQTVNQADTTTVVVASPATTSVNQQVTISATVAAVAPGSGTPSGTVTFKDGTGSVAGCTSPVTLNGSGVATCTTTSLVAGTHSFSASYGGDTNFNASSSTAAATQTVNPAASQTSVTPANGTSNVNQSVTFTASVTPNTASIKLSGKVSFTDNGTAIASCTNLPVDPTSGQAQCSSASLAGGTHSIVATYAGDSNYSTSSGNTTQTVTAIASTAALSSSLNPASVNQGITFTATVAPSNGTVKLKGAVTFTDTSGATATVLCNAVAVAPATGQAQCAVPSLPVGAHTIVATYGNDSSYTTSNASLAETVNQAATSLALTSAANPSTVNQSVAFTATISAPAGGATLSGSVSFTADGSSIAGCSAVTPSVTGVAVCTTASLTLGTHAVVATYAHDANFASSNSALTQTVNPASSTTAVVSSSPGNTSAVDQTVNFTATVSGAAGSAAFAGTMTFTDNGNAIGGCAIPVNATTGVAVCSDHSLTAGSHTIAASYGNDRNFTASSNSLMQTVNATASATTITSSLNPSVVTNPANSQDAVTFTALVTPTTASVPLSGSVTFTNNGLPIPECVAPVAVNPATGMATCTTISLSLGTHTIQAAYNGDSNYSASTSSLTQAVQDYSLATSANGAVVVTQGFVSTPGQSKSDPFTPQTITVTPASISGFNGTLNLQCTVAAISAPSGATPPLCTLSSSSEQLTASSVPQPINVTIDAGSATVGGYRVTVSATDQATGLIHTAAPFLVDVRFAATPLTLVSGATTGNTSTVEYELPANVGLSGLQCTLAAGPTLGSSISPGALSIGCAINPTSLPSAGTLQTGSATVTVTTGNTTTAELPAHSELMAAGLAGVPILALIGLAGGGKRRRRLAFPFLFLLLVSAAVLHLTGCGGSFTKPASVSGATPPGTYNLLVQGTGSDNQVYQAVVEVNVTR